MATPAAGLVEARSFDSLLEGRKIVGLQISIIIICAVVAMVDGFDTQSIALAASTIAKDLGIPAAGFGAIFGIGLFGGLVGALIGGLLGDKLGRKPVLIVALVIVAVGSLLTPFTTTALSLTLVRFLTGLGLGAALPSVVSLTGEYAPLKRRAATVGLMFCGFPLGAVVGGLASSVLIPKLGWTSVFWVGGIVPVILIPIVAIALPESVRFLAKRVDKSALETVLRRLKIDASIAPAITAAPDEPRAPLPSLFTQGRAVGTIMLWVILLLSLLMTYFLSNWIPIIATQNGLPARVAIIGAVMLNLGSILGSIVLGRFVRKRPATTIVVGYVLGAIAIVGIGQAAHSSAGLLITCLLAGFFAGGTQLLTIGLCATFYSEALRATGVGFAVGVSRLGSILGPVVGGILIARGVSTPIIFVIIGAVSLAAAIAMLLMGLVVLRKRGVAAAQIAAAQAA